MMTEKETAQDKNSKAEENSLDEMKSSEDMSTTAPSIKGFNQYCIEEIKEENEENKMVVDEKYFDTLLEPAKTFSDK